MPDHRIGDRVRLALGPHSDLTGQVGAITDFVHDDYQPWRVTVDGRAPEMCFTADELVPEEATSADGVSVPPKPDQSPVADLSRDDRTDRITTAIANTCDCADITVTVREADGTEAPLRRLARCLDGAGLIDHEGI